MNDFLGSDQSYRLLVQGANCIAICMLNPEGQVVTWNSGASSIFGYSAEEVLGRSFSLFYEGSEQVGLGTQTLPEEILTISLTKGIYQEEGWRFKKDGTSFYAVTFTYPIFNEQGALFGYSRVTRDATSYWRRVEDERAELLKHKREVQLRLEKANDAKDLFLATISHELRTPLTSILSWAQMLKMGKVKPEQLQQGYEIIESSARGQAHLINELLDLSRILAGKMVVHITEIDPYSIFQAVLTDVRPALEEKLIHVEISYEPGVKKVAADFSRLQQMLTHLIRNAIKFSESGAKVHVNFRKIMESSGGSPYIEIEVADNGKGIEPEFLPFIFDRFSQADSSIKRRHGGLGLGLAIVRHLADLQNGYITAESLGKGKGATFKLRLPAQLEVPSSKSAPSVSDVSWVEHVAEAPSPQVPLHQSHHRPEKPLFGLKLVLVEDEQNTRDAIHMMLTTLGSEVRKAVSASEALQILEEFQPDILLSDIAMPGEDGYSLIRKIRAREKVSGRFGAHIPLPAVALTAFASEEDIQQALAAGFQAHLAKPVEFTQLVKTLKCVCG